MNTLFRNSLWGVTGRKLLGSFTPPHQKFLPSVGHPGVERSPANRLGCHLLKVPTSHGPTSGGSLLRWLCLVTEERPAMHQLPMKSCSLCISVTRMRDGDKGSVSGEHAAEQTLPFAPERASGFGKQARPTQILSLYNTPSQLHTRARRGSPWDCKLLASQTSTAITPSSDL